MRFLIIYFLVQVLVYGTVLGHFGQCNFKIFRRWPTMLADIFTQHTPPPPPPPLPSPSTIKKLPTGTKCISSATFKKFLANNFLLTNFTWEENFKSLFAKSKVLLGLIQAMY